MIQLILFVTPFLIILTMSLTLVCSDPSKSRKKISQSSETAYMRASCEESYKEAPYETVELNSTKANTSDKGNEFQGRQAGDIGTGPKSNQSIEREPKLTVVASRNGLRRGSNSHSKADSKWKTKPTNPSMIPGPIGQAGKNSEVASPTIKTSNSSSQFKVEEKSPEPNQQTVSTSEQPSQIIEVAQYDQLPEEPEDAKTRLKNSFFALNQRSVAAKENKV